MDKLKTGDVYWNDEGFELWTAGQVLQVDTPGDFWPDAVKREYGTHRVLIADNEIAG